ncbi:MAG: glycosyltransferase family 2 protein [Bacilli bacterium]
MKISILIPVYNTGERLNKCLDSIINQKYKDIEIIIVNDGSTDKSEKIIQKYEKKDKRIKYIFQENKGICDTRNKLINEMNGEYALFVDSDDTLDENTCSDLVELIQKNKYDLITFDYKREYENGNIIDTFRNDKKTEEFSKMQVLEKYINNDSNFSMHLWRRIYKKELLKNIKFKSNLLPEDYATAFEVYKSAKKIAHTNFSYYTYFIASNGLTNRKKIEHYLQSFEVCKKVYKTEMEVFKTRTHIKRITSNYCNRLLVIYSSIINYENSPLKEEIKSKCINEMNSIKLKLLEKKTLLAFIIFRINKKIASMFIVKNSENKKSKR